MIFFHEGFDRNQVDAVGDCIDENKEITFDTCSRHWMQLTVSDKADSSEHARKNPHPLKFCCFLFQYQNSKKCNNDRCEHHNNGSMKRCGERESVEKEKLIDGNSCGTAENDSWPIFFFRKYPIFFEEYPKKSRGTQGSDENKAIGTNGVGHNEFRPYVVGTVNEGDCEQKKVRNDLFFIHLNSIAKVQV